MADQGCVRAIADPIRVAIDVGPLYGPRTGVGVACDGLLRALRGRADVTTHPYLTSFRSEPVADDRRLPIPGVVAAHLWSRWDRPRADRWIGDADVVHGTNYVAPPSTHPTVISVYDCWFLRHPERASPTVRRAGLTLRRAVARGAWIHASSEVTADEVRSLLATEQVRTVLLGPPPDLCTEEMAAPPDGAAFGGRPFVLSIGTEERRKGLPQLVEAFATLAAELDDPLLVLVGARGDDSDAVERAIAAAGPDVRRRIHRLGRVDAPAKSWLLRRATLLAYPSLDEGFGFPVLEAQAAGTPVIATSVGSVPEVAGDGAELVTPGDAGALAAALRSVLTDGERRSSLTAAGLRNVDRFSWDATANGLVDLYRTAIGAS